MSERIKDLTINMIKLPVFLLSYFILVLLSLILPKKWIARLFSLVQLEQGINEIINNKTNLKIFSLIITTLVYIIYKSNAF